MNLKARYQIKRVFSLGLTASVCIVFISSFFAFRGETPGLYDIFSETVSAASPAAVNINLAVSTRGETAPSGEETEESGYYGLVFLPGSVTVLSAGAALAAFLGVVSAVLLGAGLRGFTKREVSLKGVLRHYRLRSLKFLTPIQKRMLCLSEMYDTNPILVRVRGSKPVFCHRRNTGFFFSPVAKGAAL